MKTRAWPAPDSHRGKCGSCGKPSLQVDGVRRHDFQDSHLYYFFRLRTREKRQNRNTAYLVVLLMMAPLVTTPVTVPISVRIF
jgi:hypothetical protein